MKQASAGFTLIELLVTVVIVSILAAGAIPIMQVTVQRQKESELREALREIRTAIDAYKKAYDEKHMEQTVGKSGYPQSLDILVAGVEDVKDPKHKKIRFLRRLPRDPMDTDSDKSAAETWGKRSYASEADDPREGEDVYDVYSLNTRKGLNGQPYNTW